MTRMKKIVVLFLMLVLAVPSAVEAAQPKPTTWKFFSHYGPTEGPCSYVWQELFDRVEKETGGQLKIKIFWYGQHPFEGTDMLKAMKDNACQIASFYGPWLGSTEPIYEYEAIPMGLPLGNEAFEVQKKLWGDFEGKRSGPYEKVLQDKWGATLVHSMPPGSQRLFTRGFGANTPGSLKGKKIRANSAAMGSFIEALGGTPINIAWGEIYTGLAQGLIDGLHTSTYFARTAGFMDYCDTVNLWEISSAADSLMVSMSALEKLPPDVRETFQRIMRESAQKPENRELADMAIALEQMALDGVKINHVSKENRDAVAKVVHERMIPEWKKRVGPEADELLKIVDGFKNNKK